MALNTVIRSQLGLSHMAGLGLGCAGTVHQIGPMGWVQSTNRPGTGHLAREPKRLGTTLLDHQSDNDMLCMCLQTPKQSG